MSSRASNIVSVAWVELHFHLLPGVDDGPRTVEESVVLAAAAASEGTGTVVLTPHVSGHFGVDPIEIPERTRGLAEHLAREHVPLEVRPGGELAHSMVERLSNRELDAIAQGPPGRRWLLLEAPFDGLDASFTAAADELRARGFAVVVAHPERAAATVATVEAIRHELSVGSALQLTCWSVVGVYGERLRRAAVRLMNSPRVVIASDAHGCDRMPAMRIGLEALRAAGHPDPVRLAELYPRALLENGLPVGDAGPSRPAPSEYVSGRSQ